MAIIKGSEKQSQILLAKTVFSDNEIISTIKQKVGEKPALVAIDAPLIVRNKTGTRPAEKMLNTLFRKYNACAYPVNKKILNKTGSRGEKISRLLQNLGFEHNPHIKRFERKRKFFEVFSHSSMIVLFRLKSVLKYKPKCKRSYETRWKEFEKYQRYLEALRNSKPPLILPKSVTKVKVWGMKGKKLKNYENILDAILCAYTAYYCWHHPERCAIFGNPEEGCILSPVISNK